jgi:hypothetical protein
MPLRFFFPPYFPFKKNALYAYIFSLFLINKIKVARSNVQKLRLSTFFWYFIHLLLQERWCAEWLNNQENFMKWENSKKKKHMKYIFFFCVCSAICIVSSVWFFYMDDEDNNDVMMMVRRCKVVFFSFQFFTLLHCICLDDRKFFCLELIGILFHLLGKHMLH